AEQELDQRQPDAGEGGRRGADDERDEAVGGIAQLAQAPRPVADRDVKQRGDAERLHEHHVDEQTDSEAGDRAEHRARQQTDRHDDQWGEIGADPEHRDLRYGGLLQDHGEKAERDQTDGQLDRVAHGAWARTVPACGAVRTWTTSRWRMSAAGRTWICPL